MFEIPFLPGPVDSKYLFTIPLTPHIAARLLPLISLLYRLTLNDVFLLVACFPHCILSLLHGWLIFLTGLGVSQW